MQITSMKPNILAPNFPSSLPALNTNESSQEQLLQ